VKALRTTARVLAATIVAVAATAVAQSQTPGPSGFVVPASNDQVTTKSHVPGNQSLMKSEQVRSFFSRSLQANRLTQSAVIVEPNTGVYVATVTQSCGVHGAGRVGVYLAQTFELHAGETLALLEEGNSTSALAVSAGDNGFQVERFGGQSKVGCLHGSVSLCFIPGGKLSTLYAVIGQGKI